jgi:hypothetical protein
MTMTMAKGRNDWTALLLMEPGITFLKDRVGGE